MGRKDFDNLLHVIQVGTTLNAGGIVSTEVDFELPRGFIAKIFKIFMEWLNIHEDLDGIALEADIGVSMALVRDPDDVTTTQMPENTAQHDVVSEANFNYHSGLMNAADLGAVLTETIKEVAIPEHVDLITARNMRWNLQGLGSDSAILTESAARVEIYYTLEKVTDTDILELLDIL